MSEWEWKTEAVLSELPEQLEPVGGVSVLRPRHITLLCASPKTGKTTAADFFTTQVVEAGGKVLYLSEEDATDWRTRMKRWRKKGREFLFQSGGIRKHGWAETCEHVASRVYADHHELVVIDTISTLAGIADENLADKVNLAFDGVDLIRQAGEGAQGPAVLVLHHNKRNPTGRNPVDAIRGSSAFMARPDIICGMSMNGATRREFRVEGREMNPPVPKTFSIDRTPDGVVSYAAAKKATARMTAAEMRSLLVVTILQTRGAPMTVEEIREAWQGPNVPGEQSLRDAIHMGVNTSQIRIGPKRGAWATFQINKP